MSGICKVKIEKEELFREFERKKEELWNAYVENMKPLWDECNSRHATLELARKTLKDEYEKRLKE